MQDMSDALLEEIHGDLEILKRDIADIKSAIFGDEGKLSEWAKERVESYLKSKPSGFVSQEDMEKEFL